VSAFTLTGTIFCRSNRKRQRGWKADVWCDSGQDGTYRMHGI